MEVLQVDKKMNSFIERISTLEIIIISTFFSSFLLGYILWYSPGSTIFNNSPELIGVVYVSFILIGIAIFVGFFILSSCVMKCYAKIINSR